MTQYTFRDFKAVEILVAGVDSGFGSEIVVNLYQYGGYIIYATCLTKEAVEKYQARDSIRLPAVQVDVTKQDDVNHLRAQVKAEGPQVLHCPQRRRASKFAAKSLLDIIGVGLSPWEIEVSMVEPSFAKMPLTAHFEVLILQSWQRADETT
ncbi:hypothetical protein BGZ89_010756 [Linnemannia elongata]|nr:hypothetical protein BGZ89_010756 [Linnemannia elongata]